MKKIVTAGQTLELRRTLQGRKVVVAYGAGVDSTAMLCALQAAGIRPDVITFADTGAEKPETYQALERMQKTLAGWGFPQVDVCTKKTLETTAYTNLEGNCVDNQTLPSLAFGMKSCSIKWKHEPQDNFLKGVTKGPNQCPPHPLWIAAQAAGERIVKLIGYDAGPADMRRSKKAPTADANFDYVYPLQILGWARGECVKAIVETLGPDQVPVKSACFFCPASKQWELYWLAANHPELFERALHMERVALTGRHSRFDAVEFGDTWEAMVGNADRFPSSSTTVGLGRSFAWNQWARVNGVVDADYKVIRSKAAEFAALADASQEKDNALDSRFKGIKISVQGELGFSRAA